MRASKRKVEVSAGINGHSHPVDKRMGGGRGKRWRMTAVEHEMKLRVADEIEWREITNEEEMLEWRQKEDGKKKNRQKKCGGDRNLNMDGRQVNVPTYMLFILYLQPRHISLNLIRRHP